MYTKLCMPFNLAVDHIKEELLKNKECEFRFIYPHPNIEAFRSFRDWTKIALYDCYKVTTPPCKEFGYNQLKFTPKKETLSKFDKEDIENLWNKLK